MILSRLAASVRATPAPGSLIRRSMAAAAGAAPGGAGGAGGASAAAAGGGGPIESTIRAKLVDAFAPTHLEVVNESYKHSVPPGSESHFKVVVVSERYDGMKIVDRHRAVNTALADELAGGVHALSIQAKTPEQWAKNAEVRDTPNCLGGSKHDRK
mmetsp:Transcript_28047/g.97019  ORF Transcript_28047/g.97019 Transcript_28047/m.97019 type:complete len:156 (-) Transcript_28047:54-521(-)